MDDVQRALDKAVIALTEIPLPSEGGMSTFSERLVFRRDVARAAVLAFLKAMPDWESVTGPATDPIETPKYYRMAILIDDIEKETQP